MTTYTDAELGHAVRVLASLFTSGAVVAAQSADKPKTTKGSAIDAAGVSQDPKGSSPPNSDPPAEGYTAEQLTVDYVTKQVMSVGAKKGKDAAYGVMAKFENAAGEPCKRASEIDAKDYTAALDAVKEALATA